ARGQAPITISIHKRRFVRLQQCMGVFFPRFERSALSKISTLGSLTPLWLALKTLSLIRSVRDQSHRIFFSSRFLGLRRLSNKFQAQFQFFGTRRPLINPVVKKSD